MEQIGNESNNSGNFNDSNKSPDSGAIASVILGALSCAGIIAAGLSSLICLALGIAGILLAVNANKDSKTTAGTVGFVLSIIGTCLSGIGAVSCVICSTSLGITACGLGQFL
ncbi:MAG TPA: hypothetical protein DEO40_00330 [Treponema sp.]|nr:hypothetical protein [Treponema sp.]